jgi:hypothetical protein
VEKREWYGEEGIDDGKRLLTDWVTNARTVLRRVNFDQAVAQIPGERLKAARGVAAMSCDWRITKCLKYW